ncbi:LuxR C-terminal-related transcriptional regulator [Serratia nevei]|uniref:response regulator transcription factor n=1 Tax=Serratia nevei TaxID=2703794 RepID=UPI00209F73FF|nr:LuxR C-terminal-related transcriptional regulator [Serratia nevei]MCP1106588.1 LuxR C-terminal-related transcriptional regulator [Serratia nevei]
MRVAIFSDDYYLFYGLSQLLASLEDIDVINVYSPAFSRVHATYCHADVVIVSFSSICQVMNLVSLIIDRPDNTVVLTGVETPRLANFNCLKKNIGLMAFIEAITSFVAGCKGQTLSSRELAVLAMLLAGKPNTGVAKALGISEKTVSQHKMNAMRKLKIARFHQFILAADEQVASRCCRPALH